MGTDEQWEEQRNQLKCISFRDLHVDSIFQTSVQIKGNFDFEFKLKNNVRVKRASDTFWMVSFDNIGHGLESLYA